MKKRVPGDNTPVTFGLMVSKTIVERHPAFQSIRHAATYLGMALPQLIRKTLAGIQEDVYKTKIYAARIEDMVRESRESGKNPPVFDLEAEFLSEVLSDTEKKWLGSLTHGQRVAFCLCTYKYVKKPWITPDQGTAFKADMKAATVSFPGFQHDHFRRAGILSRPVFALLTRELSSLVSRTRQEYLDSPEIERLATDALGTLPLQEPLAAGGVLASRIYPSGEPVDPSTDKKIKQILGLDPLTLFFLELSLAPRYEGPGLAVRPQIAQTLTEGIGGHFKNPNQMVTVAAETYLLLVDESLRTLKGYFSVDEAEDIVDALVVCRVMDADFSGRTIVPVLNEFLPLRMVDRKRTQASANALVEKVETLSPLQRSALEIVGLWATDNQGAMQAWVAHLSSEKTAGRKK